MDSQGRQEYIRAAVSFLQNPKLVDSTLQDKLNFLKNKGLSQNEVDEALNLALINRNSSQNNGRYNFLLVLGLCIGGYRLYQAYMESKSFNHDTSKDVAKEKVIQTKPIEEKQENLDVLWKIREILDQIKEIRVMIEYQKNNHHSEMQSIKTLLLGHDKFAAPPVIPAWQLAEPSQTDQVVNAANEQEIGSDSK